MSVWVTASSIVSPLGFSSAETYSNIRKNKTGIAAVNEGSLSDRSVMVSKIANFARTKATTRLEAICQTALAEALGKISLDRNRTLFILSTTKGNIASLGTDDEAGEVPLALMAKRLAEGNGFLHSLVVSNACISGVMAIIVAKRFLEARKYDHAVILGADELSKFVVSGFESLHALSDDSCKPFDASRKGINLGEAAGVLVLSGTKGNSAMARISGGGLSNDANHISGPSRTGNELAMAVRQALGEAGKTQAQIGFVSAHGTATIFNDEMEAKAFSQLGFEKTPLHSLKGYFGHTLGAAGVVETAVCIESLLHGEVPATKGFETPGISLPLNVTAELLRLNVTTCLKTASGFGGCNAAIVIERD